MTASTPEPKHDASSGTQPDSKGPHDALELEDPYTPEEEREVLRRIDFTILPMVGLPLTLVAIPLQL